MNDCAKSTLPDEQKETMSIVRSIFYKSRGIANILATSRLCPNVVRRAVLRGLGWHVGDRTIIHWGVVPVAPNVSIGADCFVATNVFFDGLGKIVIADHCRIAPFTKILCTTHPIETSVPRRIAGRDLDLETRIEFGCWVGTQSLILPGITIARGCVIAAGSVVTASTRPNGLYGGNPARRIRDLATDDGPAAAGSTAVDRT